MTAPEHDPAVTIWGFVDRLAGWVFADDKRDEARRAGFMPSEVIHIPNVQLAELMTDGPDYAPGLREMALRHHRLWVVLEPPPDMPDRWEGDDS